MSTVSSGDGPLLIPAERHVSPVVRVFQRVLGFTFFVTLLPAIVLATMAWLIPAILVCNNVTVHTENTSLPMDLQTHLADVPGQDLSILVLDGTIAHVQLTGSELANISYEALVKDVEVELETLNTTQQLTLRTRKRNPFKCSYLEGTFPVFNAKSISIELDPTTTGAIELINLSTPCTIRSRSSFIAVSGENITAPLAVDMTGSVTLIGAAMDNLTITRCLHLTAANLSATRVQVGASKGIKLLWDPIAKDPIDSITLDFVTLQTWAGSPYHLCLIAESLFGNLTQPRLLHLNSIGLVAMSSLSYYRGGELITTVQASATSIPTNSEIIIALPTPVHLQITVSAGSLDATVEVAGSEPYGTTVMPQILLNARNRGNIVCVIYHRGDPTPDLCLS
ncbi:hypothetical protein GMRT_10294 [Giardia muris]|uniref:Uncharacterized protein n=1 Tax=Giardia muris TaxID=5742 RepID=A0A4Z1TBG9_GIAMU|nr:hypothetical protein GMRT_10294 [Giardia muris]|eukprot:TNJ29869.1 hypothetical protein GMRT_10294 [Giardia muris]